MGDRAAPLRACRILAADAKWDRTPKKENTIRNNNDNNIMGPHAGICAEGAPCGVGVSVLDALRDRTSALDCEP